MNTKMSFKSNDLGLNMLKDTAPCRCSYNGVNAWRFVDNSAI